MSGFSDDCAKYIQLHARQARLKARMDVLRDRILPELRGGKRSPRDLPYILVLQKRWRTLADWKEALKQELIGWLKNESQADQRLKQIQAQFPGEETEALVVAQNKSWASKMSSGSSTS